MPAKKTSNNASILMDESEFLKAKQASNQQELESYIRKLINLANVKYNETFLSKRAEHIKKFPLCKENYIKIKDLIDGQSISSNSIKIYYLEAELACIQADFNALSFIPNSKIQLSLIFENLNTIKLAFDKFNEKLEILNSEIGPEDKSDSFKQLLTYCKKFSSSWSMNFNRLLADCHYNFAETLVEKSKIKLEDKANGQISYVEDAKGFLTTSANFYEQANLSDFAAQTKQRIKKLEKNSKELQDSSSSNHFASLSDEKLVVVLTRLSPTLENKGKTESLWTASYKKAPTETLDKLPKVVDQSILPIETQKITASAAIKPTQRKRKSSDNDIKPAKKIRCETECTKLLNEFEQIGIEKYNLSDPFCKEELIRYKASLASKFALDIIENLSFPNKNLSDTEKLYRLQEAQNGFSKSIGFYNQVKEVIEKEKINQCINILTSTIKKLNTSVNKPKEPQTKTTMPLSSVKFFEYQGTYSARLACKFFKDSSTDTPINNQNLSLKLNSPH